MSSSHYDSPRQPNGMAQSSAFTSSYALGERNGPQDDPFNQPLILSPDLHRRCQKLEAANQKMRIVFVVLVVLCVIAIVAYVVIIISLFTVLSKMDPDQAAQFSGSQHLGADPRQQQAGLRKEFCVDEKEMHEFKDIWDPEDRKDVKDLLGGIGFVHTVKSNSPGTYCFHNLQWVPKIMGKINTRVQGSVTYIEDQQKQINKTVNAYIAMNNSTASKAPCSNNTRVKVRGDPTDPAYSVFAHYFLDTAVSYPGSGAFSNLQWIREGQKLSSRNQFDVAIKSGQFVVRHSGFYFIYSHLVFKDHVSSPSHTVIKTTSGQETKLLESVRGPASFLQGVFMLKPNDTLVVKATASQLDKSRDKASYFGAYLIRT